MFDQTMQTTRLVFRPPTVDDAPSIFEQWTSDPDTTRYLLWPTHERVETTRAFLEGCQGAWSAGGTRFPWVLARAGDPTQTPVGMLELNVAGHTVSVGYVIAPRVRGRGFATEALTHAAHVALSRPSLWRLWATTDVENVASSRVLEKARMQREGTLRRYAVRPQLGPEPRDAHVYAIVRMRPLS